MLDDDPTTTVPADGQGSDPAPAVAPKKAVRRRATKATAAPAAEFSAADQPVADQPPAGQPAAGQPASDQPDTSTPADGDAPKKAAKKSATKKAATPRKRAAKATATLSPEATATLSPEATATPSPKATATPLPGTTDPTPELTEEELAAQVLLAEHDAAQGEDQEATTPRRRGRAPAVVVSFQPPEPAPAAPRRRAAAAAEEPADDTAELARPARTRRRAGTAGVLTPSAANAPAGELEEPESADAEALEDDTADATDGPRRRRRGRRGRGRRPEGEAGEAGENEGDDTDAESGDSGSSDARGAEATEGDDAAEGSAGTARRRRRRRSGSGGAEDGSEDDVPTVVHVRDAGGREPRQRTPRAPRDGGNAADEDGVRGISGSTRMAAKRVRRQEGRDSGRKRAPILTEAEFLARRVAVDRVMVVRQKGDRTQIAVLEDGILVEHYVTKASATSYAGNVYLGKVQNVLPSMEAAFVDIGKGRNGVLYAGEVNYEGVAGGRSRSIESVLKGGQDVLVQVSKDPIGHKGARLTSQITLPGRYLVYVPEGSMTGISRKLPENERARLKDILKKVIPEGAGVIIRTAAEGASEEEIGKDVRRLQAQWEVIKGKADKGGGPVQLHAEPDLVIKVVRDIFNEDFTRLVVSGDSEWDTIRDYVEFVAPDLAPRLSQWTSDRDVFTEHRIDEQLLKALDRKVHLPSGGSLVIDRTEAMVVVDVNTGKYVGKGGNLEETVTRNNLEAAEEIARQLRLRDLGGIIVVDFIDMVLESNRDLVVRRLVECLGRDRTKHQVAEVTSLGLVQMTRKRVGQGLLESFSETCEACDGRGVRLHSEPLAEPTGPRGDRADRAPRVGPRAPKPGPPLTGPADVADPAASTEEGVPRARRRRGGRGAGSAGSVNAADELIELLDTATEVEPVALPEAFDEVVDEPLSDAQEAEQPAPEDLPVEEAPDLPAVPVEEAPVELAPVERAPVERAPVVEVPAAEAPKKRRRAAGRPAGAPTA